MRLPSRTIWVLGVSGLTFLGVLGIYFLQPKTNNVSSEGVVAVGENALLKKALSSGLSEEDSDGDGLRNWEENLWGTKIDNPDTDGDGTKDGAEVDAGRNPTIAGPDDAFSLPEGNTGLGGARGDGRDLNTTESFSRDFFSAYVDLRTSGQIENQSIQQYTFTRKLSDALEEVTLDPAPYALSDIAILPTTSKEAARSYGNIMGDIITRYTLAPGSEAEVLLEILEKEQEERVQELSHNADAYRKTVRDMLEVVVPSDAAHVHLAVVNSLAFRQAIVSNMALIYEDPLRSINAIGRYQEMLVNTTSAFKTSNAYFKKHSVTFSEEEPGYVFTRIVPAS